MLNKRLKKIAIILIIFVIMFPYSLVFAASVEQVGNAIATFAINYYNGVQNGTNVKVIHPHHTPPDGTNRNHTEDARKLNRDSKTPVLNYYGAGYNPGFDYYTLDCVGWVTFCIYNATSLEYGATYGKGYVVPTGINDTNNFREVTSGDPQPGDVLFTTTGYTHVMIYIGNNEIVHSSGGGIQPKRANNTFSGIGIARVREEKASQIDESSLVLSAGMNFSSSSSSMNFTQSEFYYNGAPDGKYSVTKGLIEWLVEALKDIMAFLINIIFYVVRMVFVGWTAMVDNLITWIMETITNEDSVLKVNTTKSADQQEYDNLTVEQILFNNVKAFDVNFFDVNNSAASTTP